MLLEVRDLSKSFGGVQAVKNVSLSVDKNQIVSIIGPNGAGKTTVFNLITGIYKADSGTVLFNEQDIVGLPQHEISKLGISRNFQNIRLFAGLSVLENVMTALDATSDYGLCSAILSLPSKRRREKESKEKALSILEFVGLDKFKDEHPKNLPYGLQRRVELARAIVSEPKLLLLDEPAAGLNPSEVTEFISLVSDLRNKYHFGILIIEHRMQVINELSEYIYVLNFGNLLAKGVPDEIVNNPEVVKAYIGEEENNAGNK
jgi:branched-chain amino acid transport system ATP-binding protein